MNSKNRRSRARWREKQRDAKRAALLAIAGLSHGEPPHLGFDARALRRAQQDRCYLCGREMIGRVHGRTRDHVAPRAWGFSPVRNTLLAGESCNSAKSHRSPRPCEMLYLAAVNEILAARRAERIS